MPVMIYESLKFLADELNKYLSIKLGVHTDPRVVLGDVAKAYDGDAVGADTIINKAIVSLVNVEEDRVAKQQENYVKTDTSVKYKAPPVYLNLYVMIAANRNDYTDSLKWIGHIVQFFQFSAVFTPITHPNIDPRIQKLIIDLVTLNFEEINNVWSTLGGKYLPSVLYKIRQVTIDEDIIDFEGGLIKEIEINDRSLNAVT
jgi:hypothetical protein